MPHSSHDEERPRRSSYSTVLPPTRASARTARHAVRQHVGPGSSPAQLDAAELLTTELVANAVMHAGTSCRLRLSQPHEGVVRVEVTDSGAGRPAMRPAQPTDTYGRGLMLVDALAARWGVDAAAPAGKTVWFEIPR